MRSNNIFWCSNKKIGDEVTIYDSITRKRYKGEIAELFSHTRVICKEEPAASGTYTRSNGNKWGTSNIWIIEAFNFKSLRDLLRSSHRNSQGIE